jgi:hypothetical protein
MAAIELKEIITTTMSFNARCHKGEIQEYVRWCTAYMRKEMRGNILKKIYDVPCMKYETRDGKVQKVKVTSANTKISEMITTIDDIDIYLRYRLKPFKSHKSAVQSNMNNAIVLKWTKDINARSGGKSYTIFTKGVITSAGWASKAQFVSITNRMLGTAFDKAELVEDSVRVILHNTKSRITADNIDCYSLRTMIAAKRLNNIRTEMSKTALKISTVEKGSKLSVYPNGEIKVHSTSEASNDAAWNFVRNHVLPCIRTLKSVG